MIETQGFSDIPKFTSQSQEAEFWDNHDLGYDFLESMKPLTREVSPESQQFFNRGLEKCSRLDYEGAREDFSQALFIQPNYDDAYISRGIARFKLGDRQGAIEDYTQAIFINPDNADAYVSRAADFSDLGQNERAIDDCTQAIRINPEDSDAYYNRGNARRV